MIITSLNFIKLNFPPGEDCSVFIQLIWLPCEQAWGKNSKTHWDKIHTLFCNVKG